MGEMADMLLDQMWNPDQDMDCDDPDLIALFELPVADLVKATSRARDEKIKGIRRYYAEHGKLSEKQRWCLAFWLMEHDE